MQSFDQTLPILITGGSGYLASWIVKYLVEAGYYVRTTVRSLKDERKIGHLRRIAAAGPGRLEFYEADLMRHGDFNTPMRGCEIVIHTASPFLLGKINNPQQQLIDPALEGTKNVLYSASEIKSVRRVVYTSSAVAIYAEAREIMDQPKGTFTEQNWNLISDLQYDPYAYSKTLAEKEAWVIAQSQKQWDLVTINPTFLLGPTLSGRTDNVSISTIQQLMNGELRQGAPQLYFGVADVRDAAQAHLLAAFTPEASGRYLISAQTMSILEMAEIMRDHFGEAFKLPKKPISNWLLYLIGPWLGFNHRFLRGNLGYVPQFDASRSIEELGLSYRPVEETIVDTVEGLAE
ncbi:NAD-dependent epimerase/dehydratase family protein [Haliscomenobacter hydrossis]|uniref:NAD-dependent epimerase/dehydratase n=1 Tax=Haliscomenobacter hydrossis (strain ATCC 27775 / DSM 1100 / LMG 10767 / O) TaxID=760192 RepID=F4KRQ2_HALH1|nr:NAD-dependent epimerase/dehydratase family protein [Haliscomenobacter hydrossis]AEE50006.1 NAD-dependent epimerase/dehydratase [Haliscomenobacter hydrossis DSM 1100]